MHNFIRALAAFLLCGTTSAQPFYWTNLLIATGQTRAVARDMDADGDLDILFSRGGQLPLGYAVNDGSGAFTSIQQIWDAVPNVYGLDAADVDLDGDVDVVCAAEGIRYFRWESDGNYWFPLHLQNPIPYADISITDLDNDGLPDLLATDGYGEVSWHRNDGAGGFDAAQYITYDLDGGSQSVAADVDGDGLKDVLSVSVNGWEVGWFRNQGLGTFGPWTQINTAYEPRAIAAADVDGDGDLDVITTPDFGSASSCFNWYANDGAGNFTGMPSPSGPFNIPYTIATSDLDSDGDVDVLCSSPYSPLPVYFLNDGSGSFSDAQEFAPQVQNPVSLSIGDLNGDDSPDVLLATELTQDIGCWWNLHVPTSSPSISHPDHGSLSVFPNPLSDRGTVAFERVTGPGARVEIIDAVGQVVRCVQAAHVQRVQLDMHGSSPGSYIIRLIDEGGIISRGSFLAEGTGQ